MPDQATQVTGDVLDNGDISHPWLFDVRQVGTKLWLTPRENASAGGASIANRPRHPPFQEIEFDLVAFMGAIDPHIQRVLEKQVKEDGVDF